MFANHFILKLVLAPLIIAGATLVSRRWGERISGLMIGLPLTSAPVSIFFAIEQGREFAASAALGAILGMIPVAVFCLGYIRASRRFSWYISAAIGIASYSLAVLTISRLSFTLEETAILVPLALVLAMFILGQPKEKAGAIAAPWWDLPARMSIAALLLISITALASQLGSKWSGLLSPFPIFSFIMATFSHRQGGTDAAWRFMRGLLTGLFGYTAFFLVIALLIEHLNMIAVYVLAMTAALVVNGFSLARLVRKNHSLQATSST